MTKVVVLPLLLGGMLLAGCNRTEDSNAAPPSPSPGKPAAVSIDAPAAEAPPVEAAPAPPAADPAAAPASDKPVVIPPFINADGPPTTAVAEGSARRPAAPAPGNGLAALNAALRAYQKANQKLPDSLDELTTAGLIAAIPEPPTGMSFAIDAGRREVVLKRQ